MHFLTVVPYNKILVILLLFILSSCQSSQIENGIKLDVNIDDNYKPFDSTLNFSEAVSAFTDLLYISESLKRDSITRKDYKDSMQALGVIFVLKKYHLNIQQLRSIIDYYLSDIDTSLFFIHSVKKKLHAHDKDNLN